MASLEILVGTRADRDPTLNEHLAELGHDLTRVGRMVTGDSHVPAARKDIGGLLYGFPSRSRPGSAGRDRTH
jgi:hypothetical protein